MVDNSFLAYVHEFKKEYKYIIKFASLTDVQDPFVDDLIKCLERYELKTASPFRKAPIIRTHYDFPNLENVEVFSSDIVLGYPASLDFLRTHIANNTGVPISNIAVFSENDPRDIEFDLYIDRQSKEYKEKYKPVLGSDYEQNEVPKYGDDYNVDFLKELAKVSKEREMRTIENELSKKQSINNSDLPKGYDTYNDPTNISSDKNGFFGRVSKTTIK